MNKRQVGKQLEEYVAENLRIVLNDKTIRPTKNSGASTELEDILCKDFICQCKVDNNKENIIIKIKDWKKMINSLPINSLRVPLFFNRNSENVTTVTLLADDFFRIIKK